MIEMKDLFVELEFSWTVDIDIRFGLLKYLHNKLAKISIIYDHKHYQTHTIRSCLPAMTQRFHLERGSRRLTRDPLVVRLNLALENLTNLETMTPYVHIKKAYFGIILKF